MTAEPTSQRRQAGVVGSPIEHSLSPVLHRAAYAALGLSDWRYGRDEVPAGQLAAYVDSLDASWMGLSVTMPGKEEALRIAGAASTRALQTGSANTLIRREDGWWADNTDIDGIIRAFSEQGADHARCAWLIGSGATARSAVMAFAEMGVSQVIVSVRATPRPATVELAHSLGLRVHVRGYDEGWPDLANIDVAVSTLPAGAAAPMQAEDDQRALSAGSAAGGMHALDVVYGPRSTTWSQALSTAGAHVVDGAAMLLHQGAVQVELMTGKSAPLEAMRAALLASLPKGE